MDLISLLFVVVGGALGGGIGALISKRFSNRYAKTALFVIPVVLLGQLTNNLSENQHIRNIIAPPSRIEQFSRTTTTILTENPKFKKAVSGMTREQIHPFIQQLTRRGLKRLSFQELKTWNMLRIKMANNSDALCSGFWTGKITPQELSANLDKLSDQDLKSWIKLSMAAAVLELEEQPFTPPPDSALQEGIKLIASKLKPEEIDRMGNTLSRGTGATNNDACWTMLKLLEGAELLSQQQQDIFLRSLASL
jgi:hypothetical protein